jgi:hypothetical protein
MPSTQLYYIILYKHVGTCFDQLCCHSLATQTQKKITIAIFCVFIWPVDDYIID